MIEEITPEGYALLMRAPDLANELLQERDRLWDKLQEIREWHLEAEGSTCPIDLGAIDTLLSEEGF